MLGASYEETILRLGATAAALAAVLLLLGLMWRGFRGLGKFTAALEPLIPDAQGRSLAGDVTEIKALLSAINESIVDQGTGQRLLSEVVEDHAVILEKHADRIAALERWRTGHDPRDNATHQ